MKQKVVYPADTLTAGLRYLKPVGESEQAYLLNGYLIMGALTTGKYQCSDCEHPAIAVETKVLQRLLAASDEVVFTFDGDTENIKAKAGKATATIAPAKVPAYVNLAMHMQPGGVSVKLPNAESAKMLQAFAGVKQLSQIFSVGGYLISTDGVSAAFLPLHGLPTGSFPYSLFQAYNGDTLTFDVQKAYVHNDRGVVAAGFGRMPLQIQRLPQVIEATNDAPAAATIWADELFEIVKPWSTLASDDTIRLRVNPDNADELLIEVKTKTTQIEDTISATLEPDFEAEMNISALASYLRHMPEQVYVSISTEGQLPYRIDASGDNLPSLITARKS